MKSVVLLSGGLDSTTAAAIAASEGYELYALTVDYGQRHAVEIEAARKIARVVGAVEHIVTRIDLRAFGGSALTSDMEVPKARTAAEMADGIPVTYVPARNAIFLALALGWAETIGTGDIFIGVNALDYSGYPDCRPEFIASFERMANLATKAAVEGASTVRIHTPLMNLTKAQIISRGLALGVDYSLTITCYDPAPDGAACGECDSCLLRLKGFRENGATDPALYRSGR